MIRRNRQSVRPTVERLDDIILLSAVSPAQFRQAYGLNAFNYVQNGKTLKPDGTGETIALVEAYHDTTLFSNVATFDSTYGLPALKSTQFYYTTTSNDGWAIEETLDVEAAHLFAPGATIDIVEAKSSSFTDLFTAENYARNIAGVVAVSMSFGGGEFSGEKSYDSYFTTPAGHTGEAFFASTGDSGAKGGVEYPSSSPNVVAVGGTSLNLADSAGDYKSESAWSGGGGGYSTQEGEPSFQRTVQSTGVRTVPDVSLDADPNTGLSIYETNPSNGKGGWQQYGGTSLASPLYAAYISIVDQGRAIEGRNTLDGPTQLLPALYSSSTSNGQHDVTTGSNGYSAHAGYDLATGQGSINGYPLTVDLLNLANKTTFGTNAISAGAISATGLASTRAVSLDLSLATTDTVTAPTTPKPNDGGVIVATIAEPTNLLSQATSDSSAKSAHDAALASLAAEFFSE